MTTRLNITLPDAVAAKLRAASDNKPSEYITRAITRQMLEDDLRALAEWEKTNPPNPERDRAADAEAETILFGRAPE